METPSSNRLGLAEPVSCTEGNQTVAGRGARRRSSGIRRRGPTRARRARRAGPILRPHGRARAAACGERRASTPAPPCRSARSAATAAGRSACTPTSTCSSCSRTRWAPSEERFVSALLQPLWDLGLTVGHHVRELARLRRAGDARPEQRRVPARAARRPLHRRRRAALPAARRLGARPRPPTTARRLLDALLQLVDERHAHVQRHALSARARHQERARRAARHRRRRGISGCCSPAATEGELDRARRDSCDDAEDFLLRVRSVLHLESGRDVNVLTHELQERVAEMFGCAGRQSQQRVEALMGEYFRHARAVVRALARVRARGARRRRGMSVVAPRRPPFRDHRGRRALRRPDARGRRGRRCGSRLFRIALVERLRRLGAGARPASSRTSSATRADDFMATDGDRCSCVRAAAAAARALRAAVRDARLRAARPRSSPSSRASTAA